MKRNWNRTIIISILVLALILSSIIVLAEENTGLRASDLAYTKQNGNTINLATALNELYYGGAGPAISASQVKAEDIGATVRGYKTYTRWTGATSDEWQIMYADNTNIYLITKYKTTNPTDSTTTLNPPVTGSVSSNYSNGKAMLTNGSLDNDIINKWINTSLWTNIGSTNNNVKATMYMLDKNVWNSTYLDGTGDSAKGLWAIGGPTVEMLCKSYEKYNYDTNSTQYNQVTSNANGYNPVSFYLKRGTMAMYAGCWNNFEHYWLSSPSHYNGSTVLTMGRHSESVEPYYCDNRSIGFRPVVCLKSNVSLKANVDRTSFTIL